MFKTMIKIANVWVAASQAVPRSKARTLANFYRGPYASPNVQDAKVVRVAHV